METDVGIPVFQQILTELLDTNNDVRTGAEQKYELIPSPIRCRLLVAVASNENVHVSLEVKQLSIVLLRRLLSSDFQRIVTEMPAESFDRMKTELLILVKTPCDGGLKKKICDASSELAKNLIDDNGNNLWPDFLNLLFDCVNSSDPSQKESALNMLAYVPGVFGNQQSRYLDVIRQMLLHCLTESPTTNLDVRSAAVKATTSFVLIHSDEKSIIKQLQECSLPIIQLVTSTIMSEDTDHCDVAMNSLVELAEKCPQLLRPQFDSLIQLCINAISEPSISESRKHLAIEIIVSMSEAAPATVRKRGAPYLAQIVSHLLTMMTEIDDDDEEWSAADSVDDEDYDSDAVIGETSLDRLACSIGGRTILPLVVNAVSQMLQKEDYKQRVAALMAISAVGEGCHTQMISLLPNLVDGILPFLKDAHHRVRHAACNALGQLATDFSPDFEEKYHEKVVPGLLMLLNDHQNPRVQAHAGAALVNFFEESSPKIIKDYLHESALKLDELLKAKMLELNSKGTKLVLEQTVVTLASLADAAQENFIPYYETFVGPLKYIIEHATDDKLKTLRGKAIEAISLIGLAVGKEKFCADATDVMNLLLRHQSGQDQLADDDPQLAYMIASWARICKILGPSFEPYLPFVMGPVLKAANIKIEVALLDQDDMNVVSGDNDWQCVNIGDQQTFGIKTTGLEEKATACQMLVCYARELKTSFANYVEETLKIMVPLLKFYFHDDVRTAAAESLPHLLESASIRGDDVRQEMWNYFYPELLKAIETEPEREVLCEMFTSLGSCMEKLGKNFITSQQLDELIRILDVHLREHFTRAQQRVEKRKDEDYDEGVEEILEDEGEDDVYILSRVSDIVHICFQVFSTDFLPFFDKIANHIKLLGGQDRSWSEHNWAICVFCDVIEYGGPACSRYKEYFLPLISEGLQSKHPEVRQASSYAWGVLGKCAGEEFSQNVAGILPVLAGVINSDGSRDDVNLNATENAIAAVTKIIQYNSSKINLNEVLPVWLNWLPVYEDEEELPHVYGFLLFLLENNHPLILGENNCNLPRIVAIFAEVLARNALDINTDVGIKIVSFLKSIQSNAVLSISCFSVLNPGQLTAITQVINQQP